VQIDRHPQIIAYRRWRGGRSWAASPITTAVSPESTRSRRIILRIEKE
jgi:hypothetical protein